MKRLFTLFHFVAEVFDGTTLNLPTSRVSLPGRRSRWGDAALICSLTLAPSRNGGAPVPRVSPPSGESRLHHWLWGRMGMIGVT